MKFHNRFYYQLKNRYLGLRLLISPFSSLLFKIISRINHILHLYLSRLIIELKVLLPFALLAILLANLFRPKSQFEVSKDNVLQNPTDVSARLFLVQQLSVTNQFGEAETELTKANNQHSVGTDDKRRIIQKSEEINSVKSQPEEIKATIMRLQSVSNQYPNYRDIYLELAILNWKLYRPFEAQRSLDRALQIDPNNQTAKKIQELIL